MGKNSKGKECGKEICQRKDGLYLARFVDKAGKRHDKCFRKLPEARNWLEEARVLNRQGGQSAEPNEENFATPDMTVDAWFEFWIENIVGDLAPNTRRNYRERHVNNVQSVIGKMLLRDVRPMHCKKILRLGKRTLTVNKTLEFRHKQTEWRAGPPKTVTSYRTIPLTNRAYNILLAVHASKEFPKQSPLLNQTLVYVDRRTGQNSTLVMTDLVFINFQTGEPSKNSSYDTHLYKICDESGMQPKVLQKLLGHASIQTTMDKYVHVTDDSLTAGVRQFEASRMQLHISQWQNGTVMVKL